MFSNWGGIRSGIVKIKGKPGMAIEWRLGYRGLYTLARRKRKNKLKSEEQKPKDLKMKNKPYTIFQERNLKSGDYIL